MDFNSRDTDSSARLRLVDVRLRAGEASLHFGGGLAGVYTATSDRSSAAHQIVGNGDGPASRPMPPGRSTSTAGVVSVHSLPPLPLPPSAPAVLDRHDLERAVAGALRSPARRLAATHASRRLERHRIAAALERARAREAGRIEQAEPQPWSPAFIVDHARSRGRGGYGERTRARRSAASCNRSTRSRPCRRPKRRRSPTPGTRTPNLLPRLVPPRRQSISPWPKSA